MKHDTIPISALGGQFNCVYFGKNIDCMNKKYNYAVSLNEAITTLRSYFTF